MAKETNRERQNNELEVLLSIFGVDVQDLRDHSNGWKPMDIKISLIPQMGSAGHQKVYARTKLHVICPSKYPKIPPKLMLEESKGLSDTQLDELLDILKKQANELKGEVMIFELAQTVQAFLHKYNTQPPGSFYDQMLQDKMKRDQELKNMISVERQNAQQVIKGEMQKRKEILKNESRTTRRTVSESSPSHRTTSSSENSENSSQILGRSVMLPSNSCLEHRTSDTLYFPHIGRKILKGCCLGHSQKGCIAFSGIDWESGQLYYITEWNIKYVHLEAKGISNSHSVDEFIQNLEKQVLNLSLLRHKNIVSYECVLCMKKKEGIVIYLVQDFVQGTSISSISGALGWCGDGASMVAKGVLDALIFLHNKGVSHSNLYDSTVFMDNTRTIRVTDFSVVAYLQELMGDQKMCGGDLPALGALIESLSPTPNSVMREFIEQCRSERAISSSDLESHAFLRPIPVNEPVKLAATVPAEKPTSLVPMQPPIAMRESRLQTEFETLQDLGRGAYGDVLKVRNMLDNRLYAIKRIPLSARSRQLYRKMTREVELLSRLNHENVVRYYTSWIEHTKLEDIQGYDKMNSDWSISLTSRKQSGQLQRMVQEESSSSDNDCFNLPTVHDSSSDGIEFVHSEGDENYNNYGDDDEFSEPASNKPKSPNPLIQVMYIQMEFCEKSTLRTAIDEGLHSDEQRLWRFFREIAEGLSHIHQQGMIHRDLKPVNIFLDSRDQVKIGDFGLATTSFLALQSHETTASQMSQQDMASTLTGKVGTAMYVSPELSENASHATYNQKVDLYSLGIILFEMSQPPFETGMERVKTLTDLRSKAIILPKQMLDEPKYKQNVAVIRWLLSHEPSQRPTAEELLSSELMPPAPLEANELQEMLRHALANPQSKAYKHIVSRCLAQESDTVMELSYHFGLVPISYRFEVIRNKVINIFRKHGAVEVVTPLLTPYSAMSNVHGSAVKLMTHSGSVVTLPSDLRIPFIRHVALHGLNVMRRYSVGRVYREKKVFNFHPKQVYECAFDIVTSSPGNLLIDAELMAVAYEIVSEIPKFTPMVVKLRINHTSLLRAILLHCGVAPSKYKDLFSAVVDYLEGRISRFNLQATANLVLQSTKHGATALVDLLLTNSQMTGSKGGLNNSALRVLIKGRGEAAQLANGAIRELESVVALAKGMGVNCAFDVCAGLPIGYDHAKSGGIVWQMMGDNKQSRSGNANSSVLAHGFRYDGLLSDFKKQGNDTGVLVTNRDISGAGFSLALDKLLGAIISPKEEEITPIDVVVCVTGSRPPLRDVTQILRLLWAANIRTGLVEATNSNEAQEQAKDLGANHTILLDGTGSLRIRSSDSHERHILRDELTDYIQKLLREDSSSASFELNTSQSSMNSSATNIHRNSISHSIALPSVEVFFVMHEKPTANMRKRYENQVQQQMAPSLSLFGRKEKFFVMVVELPVATLNALVGAIDPRDIRNSDTDNSMAYVLERFPKHKRYIIKIMEEITDLGHGKEDTPIVALFSLTESSYRILL